jgi:hypothetical protein
VRLRGHCAAEAHALGTTELLGGSGGVDRLESGPRREVIAEEAMRQEPGFDAQELEQQWETRYLLPRYVQACM